uniref:Chlorophyll a-b binding protein, chloroplastic n=1 Tax=Haptolina ericina TaxID=156174 RepID=A0A7S3B6E7_9EUKA|mmetsp:Transcript_50346/g.113148  ORF Transcript_50346/g.113148 Transcript_50346/m.113148 type:complete len:214 (+) Transcript_50346:31-672(+)
MLSLYTPSTLGFNAVVPLRTTARSAAADVRMGIADMEGIGPETANKIWDPLELTTMASDKTLAWYRHAELKHGRVAMAAFVGFAWVQGGGGLFPGAYSLSGATFESLGHDSFAAWDALPVLAKTQIFLSLGLLEFCSENTKPHYMSGGTPGKITILGAPLAPSTNLLPKDAAKVAEKRIIELKNGRLAMLGMMSVFAHHSIPGSVPFFTAIGA